MCAMCIIKYNFHDKFADPKPGRHHFFTMPEIKKNYANAIYTACDFICLHVHVNYPWESSNFKKQNSLFNHKQYFDIVFIQKN